MNNLYLAHHGILGQKWGIRRYQNYDGSYTQAGMKRYNNSLSDYESKKKAYDNAKSQGKTNNELANDKIALNKAKRQLNKDYKHLKLDKLADKGKTRYANGETITNNNNFTNKMLSASAATVLASRYLANNGMLDKKTANIIASSSVVATGAAYAKRYLIDETHNRQLRAYYSHTSKY